MIKKLAILLLVITTAWVANAQLAVGGWTIYSSFNGVDKIVETKGMTYYLSGNALFAFDKTTEEINNLTPANILNDSDISGVYPHPDGNCILIAYSSGNMDKLFDDGQVINIPDLRDATLTYTREIRDVAFGKDNFYVATNFGLITFNEHKNEVRETLYSDGGYQKVMTIGDYVVVSQNNQLKHALQSERLTSPDKLKYIGNQTRSETWQELYAVSPTVAFGLAGASNPRLLKLKFDFAGQTIAWEYINYPANTTSNGFTVLAPARTGAMAANASTLFMISADGTVTPSALPEALKNQKISAFEGLREVWAGNAAGLALYDLSSATPTVLKARFGASDLTVKSGNSLNVGPSGKIYYWNRYVQLSLGIQLPFSTYLTLSAISDNSFSDISPTDVEVENSRTTSEQPPYHVWHPFWVEEDPADADAFYVGNWYEGIYRVKNGKQTHKYYISNSPMGYNSSNSTIISSQVFDRYGNLWAIGETPSGKNNMVVLPAAKLREPNVTSADWRAFVVPGISGNARDGIGMGCRLSDKVFFSSGRYTMSIVVVDTKGTPDIKDDSYVTVNNYIDQDGKEMSWYQTLAFAEDQKGRVWVGTDNGVFEITNPSKITEGSIQINHLKVPRNDGTNLADYLLDAQMVSGISVDPSNRKWISTTSSGVYLVSENGDEILEHYTVDNSMLPTNIVYSVACDPNSNKVYFATANGLVEYSSSSAPGKDDYSEVYAYPNPVRPEYTGWITITNLMDNTLVKIADAAGNVFFQGRSEGGMLTWDGCNASGERVKTGVYYVFASQNETGTSGCVTKIMVVN